VSENSKLPDSAIIHETNCDECKADLAENISIKLMGYFEAMLDRKFPNQNKVVEDVKLIKKKLREVYIFGKRIFLIPLAVETLSVLMILVIVAIIYILIKIA
jgi:hypothetical protein